MNILVPLGFLGLLGIAVLILIYIIKPNYQQKMISSTLIWKMSLKFRKRSLPVSRIRSLLILLCQILIITICAFILTQPVISAASAPANEKIVVIDASASMLAQTNGETRFERAVDQAKSLASQTLDKEDGAVTVILAATEASFIVRRAGPAQKTSALQTLAELVAPDLQCSYGNADMEGAMALAEQVLAENPSAEVLLYTATDYIDKGKVKVINVSEEGEWNAAILNVAVSLDENYYVFTVDVASYGRDISLRLNCSVYGANNDKKTIETVYNVSCSGDKTQTVVIHTKDNEPKAPVYAYDSALFEIAADDSFAEDNKFFVYGGRPETIRIQYTSALPNPFVSGILMDLRDTLRLRWNIELTEVRPDSPSGVLRPELKGFDLYIFEHAMPESIPTDGIVLLINPQSVPEGVGFKLGDQSEGEFSLSAGQMHPVMNGITPENIFVSQYRKITLYDDFDPIMYCGDDPVLLVRNDEKAKIAVLSFSVNYSDLPVRIEFPLLIYNIFNYYLPSTITDAKGQIGFVFDVNDTVTLNARGLELNVTGPENKFQAKYDSFPQALNVSLYGTYSVKQTLVSGAEITENFYVKIAADQSNITRKVDTLPNPLFENVPPPADLDLLLYLAIALVTLLFVEWWLQSKENF